MKDPLSRKMTKEATARDENDAKESTQDAETTKLIEMETKKFSKIERLNSRDSLDLE
jgi:hypothetical protein